MDQKHKFDKGKLQFRLVPPMALEKVAEVLTYGVGKYAAHSWVNVDSSRYVDAAYRHLEAARHGLLLDDESGLPHLAMAITNLMFLLERQETTGEDQVSYYAEQDEHKHGKG